ncbi:unnamed protein product [Choristocarpus tenellus]
MEDGSPFTVDWNFSMDLVFHAGVLADAGRAPYRDKSLLLDVTFVEVQATSHLPLSSTSNGVAAAAAEARKHTHYECSFDPHSYNLNAFAVESLGRLSKQAECFPEELATHIEEEELEAIAGKGRPNPAYAK